MTDFQNEIELRTASHADAEKAAGGAIQSVMSQQTVSKQGLEDDMCKSSFACTAGIFLFRRLLKLCVHLLSSTLTFRYSLQTVGAGVCRLPLRQSKQKASVVDRRGKEQGRNT